MERSEKFSQYMVFVLSCAAIILVSLPAAHPWQRWGYVVGLLSQPFWIYTAIYHKQLGVFLTSCVYTVSWIFGIWLRF